MRDFTRDGELRARVDAETFVVVLDDHAGHGQAIGSQQTEHVREVVLALRVIAVELIEMAQERRCGKAIDAGIALANRALLLRAVLLFDDAGHVATRVTHDTPVSKGIGGHHREHRRGGTTCLMRFDEMLDGACRDERGVAAKHHDVAFVALELVRRAHNRMTSTQHFELIGDDAVAEQGLDLLASVADDHVDVIATGLMRRIYDPTHERLAQHLVDDLWLVGFHAGTSACCKNQSFSFHMRSH